MINSMIPYVPNVAVVSGTSSKPQGMLLVAIAASVGCEMPLQIAGVWSLLEAHP